MRDERQGICLGCLMLKKWTRLFLNICFFFFSFTVGVNVFAIQKPAELDQGEAGVCVAQSDLRLRNKSVEPMIRFSACEQQSGKHALNSCVFYLKIRSS